MIFSGSTFALAALASLAQATPLGTPFTVENGALLVQRQVEAPCGSGVHVMVGGGCSIPCQSNVAGLLNTLLQSISRRIPGSTQWFVPYDGSQQQARVSTPLMINEVNSFAARCPDTPIVFAGYSLGGIVTMNTLCGGVPAELTENIIAAITYGEETYVGGQSYDVGTCTASAPKYPRANVTACQTFAPIIRSYCDADDPQCCTGGTDQDAHFQYANRYDTAATDYIVSQFQAVSDGPTCPAQRPGRGSPFSAYLAYLALAFRCTFGIA